MHRPWNGSITIGQSDGSERFNTGGDDAPLLASQEEENEWPREDQTNPFAQPERTGIVRVHQKSQDQPGAKVEPSRRTTAQDRRAQATFFRRRHQPRRPAPVTLGWIIRLIDDGSECNFLDKAVVGGRRFGDWTSITRRPKNNGLLEK
jgi:hypothetical protein